MDQARKIAVVGAGISGLAAAWLLARRHDVTLFEADDRLGGHSHTVQTGGIPIDTGFIVYNEPAYPNLTSLFRHLNVPTQATDMSFSVSLDAGRLEYSGRNLAGLFAQPGNVLSPRFWAMLRGILRFYREAPQALPQLGEMRLDEYLRTSGFSPVFCEDHLYPMIAAVWSTPAGQAGALPAAAFIRFCENHGLLKLSNRPLWRTVTGGAGEYVTRLHKDFWGRIATRRPVISVRALPDGVEIRDAHGEVEHFDAVVLATHADQALALLEDATPQERNILGNFRYTSNEAVLHQDASLMPRRRAAWAAWNYAGGHGRDAPVSVTYWMNMLHGLPGAQQYFLSLNPHITPAHVLHRQVYTHPVFDVAALRAQKQLFQLQGFNNRWFCGAYFGAGFHEDGLQAGLAVAEALGGGRRPWQVADESGRIHINQPLLGGGMSTLYHGIVTHARVAPKRHKLKYRIFSLLLDLTTLDAEAAQMRLFSRNRFNLFSFHDRDYGDESKNPAAWAQAQMQIAGLETAGSRITLLTMPRLLGYAFNPISVYFCHSADGALAAILYEVNNTFGQRHSYFCAVTPGGTVQQSCAKTFYVSPFMDMDLRYDFCVQPPDKTLRLRINVSDAQQLLLTAALTGRGTALNDAALLRAAITYPLLTIKVMAGIHWEALRLWLKGMRPRPRPAAPAQPVSFTPGRSA